MKNLKKIIYSELIEFKYQFLLKNGELNSYLYLKNYVYVDVLKEVESKRFQFIERDRVEYGLILEELTHLSNIFLSKNPHLSKEILRELTILEDQTSNYQLDVFINTYDHKVFLLYNCEGDYVEKFHLFYELKTFVNEFGKSNIEHSVFICDALKKIEFYECSLNLSITNSNILDKAVLTTIMGDYFASSFFILLVLCFFFELVDHKKK